MSPSFAIVLILLGVSLAVGVLLLRGAAAMLRVMFAVVVASAWVYGLNVLVRLVLTPFA